jgi:hypothetical protein
MDTRLTSGRRERMRFGGCIVGLRLVILTPTRFDLQPALLSALGQLCVGQAVQKF